MRLSLTSPKDSYMTTSKDLQVSNPERAVALEIITRRSKGRPTVLSSRTMKKMMLKKNTMTSIGEGSQKSVRCLARVALDRANKKNTLTGGNSKGSLMSSGAKHQANRKMVKVGVKNNLSSKSLTSSMNFSISRDKRLSQVCQETTRKVPTIR